MVFLLYTSKSAIYVGLPLSAILFVATDYADLDLYKHLDVLKVFLSSQYTWPIGDWQYFVHSLTTHSSHQPTYRFHDMKVDVVLFLDLINHVTVVDSTLTDHCHLDLPRVRELSFLELGTPVSPS